MINGIRVGQHPDKIRVVIDIHGDTDFQAKVADNPRRLLISLPATADNITSKAILAYPFRSVSENSIGQGITELRLPMESPYIIRNAFMIAGNGGAGNRLVLDLFAVSQIEFTRQTGIAHGPLVIAMSAPSIDGLLKGIAGETDIAVPPQKPTVYTKPVIVIDAGHGGKDPGAISPRGIKEKDITLSMAKTIARVLNESGRYDARLTRSEDRYIKLYNRVKIAQRAKAGLFISIHADSVGNKTTKGASVYTLSNKASDVQTAKLAARENRADLIGGIDLNIEDEDVSAILIDLSMRETMNRSKILANSVIVDLRGGGVQTLKGPHRYAGFAVLKAPDIPSILMETGFVSNENEARTLLNPEHQEKIGRALLRSIDRFYDK